MLISSTHPTSLSISAMNFLASDAISVVNLYLCSLCSNNWQSLHVNLSQVSQNNDNFSWGWFKQKRLDGAPFETEFSSIKPSSFGFIVWSFVIFNLEICRYNLSSFNQRIDKKIIHLDLYIGMTGKFKLAFCLNK